MKHGHWGAKPPRLVFGTSLFIVSLLNQAPLSTRAASMSFPSRTATHQNLSKEAASNACYSSSASAGDANNAQPSNTSKSMGSHAEIATRIVVPAVTDAAVGSTEDVPIQVISQGSKHVPTGYVAFWDSDIPSIAKLVNKGKHNAPLNSQGIATFQLRESLPGVPFDVTGASVYYVPKSDSGFGASSSCAFEIKQHMWAADLTATLESSDGSGIDVPLKVTVADGGEAVTAGQTAPSGDITVTDVDGGLSCRATVSGAVAIDGSGTSMLTVNLPAGQNNVTVEYDGDAFHAMTQTSLTADVSTAGWAGSSCPSEWVKVASAGGYPVSGSDIPLKSYGVPRVYGTYDSAAMVSREVGTFVVQLDWADVESTAGLYNFAPADAELRAAIAQGKHITLLLRFQSGSIISGTTESCEWNKDQFLPKWAMTQLGPSGSFCSKGTGLMIPDYWSAEFIRLWTGFVDAVAAHFAPWASDISTVIAPVGLGDEAAAITGPNAKPLRQDVHRLHEWRYTPQLWEAWQEDMLSYYKQKFSSSSYAANPPWVLYTIDHQDKCTGAAVELIPGFPPTTVRCDGAPVEVDVAEWAVDHGFGLTQTSLDGTWILRNPDKDDPPAGDVNTIFSYAMRHTPRPMIELQTFQSQSDWCNLAVKRGLPPCRANAHAFTDVENDIYYARAAGITTIDWFENDLMNPRLVPLVDLWRQLQAIPGTGKIPTTVAISPSDTSVHRGERLAVTVSVHAPGISNAEGFAPGGRIELYDDAIDRKLGSIYIQPDTATGVVTIKVPTLKGGHMNLMATFSNEFLWMNSRSPDVRVAVR